MLKIYINKILYLYNIDPRGFIIFVGINIILYNLGNIDLLTSINNVFISRFSSTLFIFLIFLNRIVFQRNILKNIFENVNNIKKVSIDAIKCYLLYFLYLALAMIVILQIFLGILRLNIFHNIEFNNINGQNTAILILFIIIMQLIVMLVFFKLIFIEHILVEKNYYFKIKDLVKNSFETIKKNKFYIILLYCLNNLFIFIRTIIGMSVHDNNIAIGIILNIVFSLIYCIYIMLILMFYRELKLKENEINI